MKLISEHVGRIIVALASVALLISSVALFKAPIGDFFGNIVDAEKGVGDKILTNIDNIDVGALGITGDAVDLSKYTYTPSYSLKSEKGKSISLSELSPNEGKQDISISVERINYFDISKVPTTSKVTNNGDGTLTISGGSSAVRMNVKISDVCPELKVGDTIFVQIESTGQKGFGYQTYDSESGQYKTTQFNPQSSNAVIVTQEILDSYLLLYGTPASSEDFDQPHTITGIQIEVLDDYRNKREMSPYVQDLSTVSINVDDGKSTQTLNIGEDETKSVTISNTYANISAEPDAVYITCEYYKKDPVKVVATGDSITYGYGAGVGPNNSFIKLACNSLGYELDNYAINSSTAAVFPEGANNFETVNNLALINRYDEMSDDADLVFVSIGSNDWYYTNIKLGDSSSTEGTTFYGALKILCEGLKEKYPQTPIVFATPIERWNSDINGETNVVEGKYITEYCNAIKEVCKMYDIIVVDMYNISGIDTSDEEFRNTYVTDGIHPNLEGHKMMANVLVNYFEKYFGKYFDKH